MALKSEKSLSLLAQIEKVIEQSHPIALAKKQEQFWIKDKNFIEKAKQQLCLSKKESTQWVFEQMRNLSQGFGSYCDNLKKLDCLLDDFYVELENLLIMQHKEDHLENEKVMRISTPYQISNY